jgi:hypothetical protein
MGSSLSGWTIGIPNLKKVRVCAIVRGLLMLMNKYPIANGQPFHFSFISFFRLHVRLFLNTLPLQPALSDPVSPSLGLHVNTSLTVSYSTEALVCKG